MSAQQPPVFAGRRDWLIILTMLAVSLLAWLLHSLPATDSKPAGYRIRIFTEPEKIINTGVPADNRLIINGRLGSAEIEWDGGGKVRIASSTCPCKTCVNMGWVSDASLICVPNGIIVEPQTGSSQIDAVTR